MIEKFDLGDVVQMKKHKHPCGSYDWKVIRLGADIKLKCVGQDLCFKNKVSKRC